MTSTLLPRELERIDPAGVWHALGELIGQGVPADVAWHTPIEALSYVVDGIESVREKGTPG